MARDLNNFGVIPARSNDSKQSRDSRDRECYIKGKEARQEELPRDVDVQYKDKRDRDCFNMGYSYAVWDEDND